MPACPYPTKKRYTSKKAAQRGRNTVDSKNLAGYGRLVVFPCGGHWHVGHRRARG